MVSYVLAVKKVSVSALRDVNQDTTINSEKYSPMIDIIVVGLIFPIVVAMISCGCEYKGFM